MKVVVFTFDDGPGETLTPRLLALLRRHRVRATFFPLGMRACRNPEVLDLVQSEGHELGCHGYLHCNAWKAPPRRSIQDIERGYDSLRRWVAPDGMFRPPHGKVTLFTLRTVFKRRARVIWWTHDSGDTRSGSLPPVREVVDRVMRCGGGVVLLHDFDRDGGANHPRHDFVLNVTSELIRRARKSGLRILPVGELLNGTHVDFHRHR